ncbi:hypothetical protein OIU34_23500 [Pararhizobium sp. BT-229]|uniref:hypothetical protein n=1 Tax=Pararhizobium sp. BT-229 TaxID=2986923 RepID=UPI0021F7C8C0|nr:hypothetical protein [Pararhizobium sp. BT-229]MCV9964862.1 hypothetical protein [Pararhizobium sp. BT-229]
MKFSKAAMRTRHVQLGHMTMMQPAPNTADERQSAPARTYSTERYAPTKSHNGIAIPQQFRDRIEASMSKVEEEEPPLTFLSGGRGFF